MNLAKQDGLQIALELAKRRGRLAVEAAKQNGKPVEISRNGYWCVPPERRPKGWEKMGLKERG